MFSLLLSACGNNTVRLLHPCEGAQASPEGSSKRIERVAALMSGFHEFGLRQATAQGIQFADGIHLHRSDTVLGTLSAEGGQDAGSDSV